MNDLQLANRILELLGGNGNVNSVTHCVTRLRVTVNDTKVVQKGELESVPDVIGVNQVGNQTQVILGGKVHDVYDQFIKLVGDTQKSEPVEEEKKGIISRFLDAITSIFNPILPAIIGAGLLKGILIFLMFYEIVSIESDTYQFLNVFSDAAFYFLPILLAYSAANRFKANPYVAASIGGILVHPNLINMMSASDSLTYFGIPVTNASYASSVLPIIMGVWLMAYVERILTKYIPKILKTILVPVLTILIVAPIILIVLGPIGTVIGNGLGEWFIGFYNNFGLLAGALFGAAFPFLVLIGMHVGFAPVMLQSLTTYGVDYIMGLNVASNSAQAGATTAVYLRTKNRDFKAVAGAAALNAIIGITEPALFGVTSKLKKPLIAVSIGGAVGGAIAGYFRVEALGIGTGPIAGVPLFIGPTFIYFIISCVVAYIISFVLTLVIGFEDIPAAATQSVEEVVVSNPETIDELKTTSLLSPLSGEVKKLEEVDDHVFSTKMMGDGVAIIPNIGKVFSPVNGTIVTAFTTGHAVGIKSNDGAEVLIHVGLDTVELEGKPFTMLAKEGDLVHTGDLLVEFDIQAIKDAGYNTITPIVITNSNQYDQIEQLKYGTVREGEAILTLEKKKERNGHNE
ncbi:beta-glucoside-specific PTS transporter subunit IIABC [Fundicoccus culcitae]|uniref:Beta-glucoside-specific PTS transporter subunit IIABC n=1 Tax=Fundicoccus culcitae TaxID=2969821 RepID=A0ABY5P3S8_9LACT|nr:beta-glucoside-specific PTS transporter subunit IIABC [Fundicoccus culcitae]UUX33250.1 beta-glucoside-specific PTS transporter subunit IIABC [Fundicoccus culcitae]